MRMWWWRRWCCLCCRCGCVVGQKGMTIRKTCNSSLAGCWRARGCFALTLGETRLRHPNATPVRGLSVSYVGHGPSRVWSQWGEWGVSQNATDKENNPGLAGVVSMTGGSKPARCCSESMHMPIVCRTSHAPHTLPFLLTNTPQVPQGCPCRLAGRRGL